MVSVQAEHAPGYQDYMKKLGLITKEEIDKNNAARDAYDAANKEKKIQENKKRAEEAMQRATEIVNLDKERHNRRGTSTRRPWNPNA